MVEKHSPARYPVAAGRAALGHGPALLSMEANGGFGSRGVLGTGYQA